MFHFPGPRWVVLISLGGAVAAHAQQPGAPSSPASAAAAPAPASRAGTGGLSYRSALEGYQPFGDEKLGSWRDANDNVSRIGGWREYAREAQGAAPAAAPAPATAPAAGGRGPHSGHGKP